MKNLVYLSLGSNIGNRLDYLQTALSNIRENSFVEVLKTSEILNTKALEYEDQPDFLNQVIEIRTSLKAEELLLSMQKIENNLGRVRTIAKGPRTIDIDILLYNDLISNSSFLTLPHPGIFGRKFLQDLLLSLGVDVGKLKFQ